MDLLNQINWKLLYMTVIHEPRARRPVSKKVPTSQMKLLMENSEEDWEEEFEDLEAKEDLNESEMREGWQVEQLRADTAMKAAGTSAGRTPSRSDLSLDLSPSASARLSEAARQVLLAAWEDTDESETLCRRSRLVDAAPAAPRARSAPGVPPTRGRDLDFVISS